MGENGRDWIGVRARSENFDLEEKQKWGSTPRLDKQHKYRGLRGNIFELEGKLKWGFTPQVRQTVTRYLPTGRMRKEITATKKKKLDFFFCSFQKRIVLKANLRFSFRAKQIFWAYLVKGFFHLEFCVGNDSKKMTNSCVGEKYYSRIAIAIFSSIFWEMVRTTKIRTSKTKKNSENQANHHNVEKIYKSDQNVEIRTSKMSFEFIRTTTIRTSKIALK